MVLDDFAKKNLAKNKEDDQSIFSSLDPAVKLVLIKYGSIAVLSVGGGYLLYRLIRNSDIYNSLVQRLQTASLENVVNAIESGAEATEEYIDNAITTPTERRIEEREALMRGFILYYCDGRVLADIQSFDEWRNESANRRLPTLRNELRNYIRDHIEWKIDDVIRASTDLRINADIPQAFIQYIHDIYYYASLPSRHGEIRTKACISGEGTGVGGGGSSDPALQQPRSADRELI